MSNAYEVLGPSPEADGPAIKRRYRELLRRAHPDLNPGDPHAPAKTKRLIEAYETLSDPSKRAALDSAIRAKAEASRRKRREAEKQRREAEKRRKATAERAKRSERSQSKARVHYENRMVGVTIVGGGNIQITQTGSATHISTGPSRAVRGDIRTGSGTLKGVVQGDVIIEPGSRTTLSGQVMGDVVAGAGCDVTIKGQVMGDVIASGCTVTVLGVLMGDIIVGTGTARIRGVHMGDVK